ncbi:MAG: hypothetical protein JKY71_01775 [Alphaproteobacteria bacterium]|nr:hypothetical protein [Alphaproteobacteria bacterium]
MNTVPQVIRGVSHPLVADMYLKRDSSDQRTFEDVLVIQTINREDGMAETEFNSFDTYLIDLLTDLEDLKAMAEQQIGHIDRVDIRAH